MSKKRRKSNNQKQNPNRNNGSNRNGQQKAASGEQAAVEPASGEQTESASVSDEQTLTSAGATASAEVQEPVSGSVADQDTQDTEAYQTSGYAEEADDIDETPEATLYQPGLTEREEPGTEEYAYADPMQDVMKEHSFYAPRSSEEDDWNPDEEEEEESFDRENVNRMKKLILAGIVVLFLIPLILCLILFFHMHSLEKEMEQLRQDVLSKKERMQQEVLAKENVKDNRMEAALDKEALAKMEKNRAGSTALQLTGRQAGEEKEDGKETATEEIDPSQVEESKKIYLTFDDGPSDNTGRLLDVLKEENVKATFFMVLNDKCDRQVIRRMAAEGHTLGIHSASHVYTEIYADLDSFRQDVQTVHDLLYEMTGQDVKLYRFPGGSSNRVSDVPIEDCIAYLEEAGYTYFDWNASNGDSSGSGYTADQLTENVLRYVRNNTGASVVLMHDFTPCPETIDALPGLIRTLREEGYVFLPIDSSTTPVHHRKTETEKNDELEEEKKQLEKASIEREKLEKASEEIARKNQEAEESEGSEGSDGYDGSDGSDGSDGYDGSDGSDGTEGSDESDRSDEDGYDEEE